MASTVWLFSDRPSFIETWQRACHGLPIVVSASAPSDIARRVGTQHFAVLDGGAEVFDEDELLASACLVRSLGGLPVVVADPARALTDSGLLHELCEGLFASSLADVERLSQVIARRADSSRHARFEYLTVSPADGSLLALLGSGTSVTIPRPAHASDDRSEVTDIALGDDPTLATIRLASGAQFELRAAERVELPATTSTQAGAPIPLEGVRLGARLRELRTAAGLTQAELARRTGIHRPNIARVEAGRHTPSLETLARLAGAIGIPTTKLFADDTSAA